MVIQPTRQPVNLLLRFLGGVIVVISLTLLIFFFMMRPAAQEFADMTLFLSITALISVLAGYGAYHTGWLSRSPQLKWTLISGYILSTVLTFVNVWVTARLMFINQHDLSLATILLVFAAGIAIALGYLVSVTVTDKIQALNYGAAAIARGEFTTRIVVTGNDEMADLARAFNSMAAQLQQADVKQREVEAMRSNLIAWAGHDLRTPLASVRAIVEALADGVVDDQETVARYLGTAKRDIDSLAMLIDDLFELAQLDAGGIRLDLQQNSLSDLVSDTLESFGRLAAEKGVALGGAVDPGVDPVQCDARHISRVLSNLVGNAIRHTPAGGRVFVHTRVEQNWIVVDVTDSGEGISAADLPHVFDQFYRVERSRSRASGGAGLGLAIARGFVEAHGGRIGVMSRPGKGAHFYFTLPKPTRPRSVLARPRPGNR